MREYSLSILLIDNSAMLPYPSHSSVQCPDSVCRSAEPKSGRPLHLQGRQPMRFRTRRLIHASRIWDYFRSAGLRARVRARPVKLASRHESAGAAREHARGAVGLGLRGRALDPLMAMTQAVGDSVLATGPQSDRPCRRPAPAARSGRSESDGGGRGRSRLPPCGRAVGGRLPAVE